MSKSQIGVLVLFGFVTVFSTAAFLSSRVEAVTAYQFSLPLVSQAVGLVLAATTGLTMLLRSLGGATVKDLSPFVFPLLAGLALINGHWSIVAALGAIVVVALGGQALMFRAGKSDEDSQHAGFH